MTDNTNGGELERFSRYDFNQHIVLPQRLEISNFLGFVRFLTLCLAKLSWKAHLVISTRWLGKNGTRGRWHIRSLRSTIGFSKMGIFRSKKEGLVFYDGSQMGKEYIVGFVFKVFSFFDVANSIELIW